MAEALIVPSSPAVGAQRGLRCGSAGRQTTQESYDAMASAVCMKTVLLATLFPAQSSKAAEASLKPVKPRP
ncbi:hypothetical protein [Sporisorium scitamineum]|uniref:Uncharacterized protein n=1 Tax=Sporisorium scitamineum TaxID=49012 RepID=A0A0F7RXI3_9BASI|nr:hypothetical protein [Sporisorium scitamineum]